MAMNFGMACLDETSNAMRITPSSRMGCLLDDGIHGRQQAIGIGISIEETFRLSGAGIGGVFRIESPLLPVIAE